MMAFAVAHTTQYRTVAVTSALTHALLGQFKTGAVILGNYLLFSKPTTAQQVGGAGAAMACLVVYSHFTAQDKKAAAGAVGADKKAN
jgi:hypothetical protein